MKILIPVDGSAQANAALDFVASRSTLIGQEPKVHLLNVQPTLSVRVIRAIGREEAKAYQRAQAVLQAQDMANRIRVDAIAARDNAYLESDQYGLLDEADCTVIAESADRYLCECNNTLAGAGVAQAGQKLGSIIGARGCIENLAGTKDGEKIIRVTIAWQGSTPTIAPASTCGQGQYGAVDPNDPDDPGDRYRRTASVDVVLANLGLDDEP